MEFHGGYGMESPPISASSGFTLEELDTLMMDEDSGHSGEEAGSTMIKELQQLILFDSPTFSSNSSSQQRHLEAATDGNSLDGLSIESWTSDMMGEEEVCSSHCYGKNSRAISVNSGIPGATQILDRRESGGFSSDGRDSSSDIQNCYSDGEESRDSSAGLARNWLDPSWTNVANRGGFAADRGDLIGILQEAIATHMVTDKKNGVVLRERAPKRIAAAREEEDAVEALKSVIQSRRMEQRRSTTYGYDLRGVPPDVMTLLHDCAHAVAVRDVANANHLAVTLRRNHGASPHAADGARRVAYYFIESLIARVLGTGTALAAAASTGAAGTADVMERVYEFRLRATPSPLLPHFYSTDAILAAVQGRRFVHIIEIGMARNRFQWSLLLQALAYRRGGPPRHLRVTAVDSPQNKPLLEQLGQRIVFESARLGVTAEVELEIAEAHAWETVLPRIAPRTLPDEAVVVNALFALDFLEDETAVQARSPRRAVLAGLRRMDPAVLVLGINHGYRAVPQFSFLERFAQAVTRFNAKFDAAVECGSGEELAVGRAAYEGQFLGPEILNLVACDGSDRLVRTAPCEEWERAMSGAGFVAMPWEDRTVDRGREMMLGYNRNFELDHSNGWMKISWKKVTTQCVSVWQPKRILPLD